MSAGVVAWLISKGVPEQFARPLLILTIVLAAIPLLLAIKGCYDRSVVEDATNKSNAEFRENQIEIERELGGEKDRRDTADAAEVAAEEEKVDEAEADGRSAADDVWRCMWNDAAC